jgi:hypothetical protein
MKIASNFFVRGAIARGVITLLASAGALTSAAFAGDASPRTVDLGHFDEATAWNQSLSAYNRAVDFIDNDTVVVGLVYDNPSPALSDRRNPRAGPHLFGISTIDFATGAVTAREMLGNAEIGRNATLFGLGNGRLVVSMHNRVRAYNRALHEVWQLAIDDDTYLQASANRKNFYLWSPASEAQQPKYELQIFSTTKLEPEETLALNAQPLSSMGRNVLAAHGAAGVYLYRGESTERVISINAQTTTCRPGPRPKRLISRGILVDCNGILVLTDLDGRALAERWLENKEIGRVETSADTNRIAVLTYKVASPASLRDTSSAQRDVEIVVLDGSLRPVHRIAPLGTGITPVFALSPDGTRLAYLSEKTLALIEIPKGTASER